MSTKLNKCVCAVCGGSECKCGCANGRQSETR